MPLIIAEAGVNHNGDINIAKELIDSAKFAGADIVKFQTFKTEAGISKNTPVANYQKRNSSGKNNQFELIKSLELDFDNFKILKNYAEKRNIEFLSTAFDLESINFLKELNLKRSKIPSGEINNYPYLKEISKLGKPIILSTGMSTLSEIEFAINTIIKFGTKKSEITVLQCTTEYPAPKEFANLNAMKTIADTFEVNIGYSDHTQGISVAVYAAVLGAKVIEKHITLDRKMLGPDHYASIEPNEFKEMVNLIKETEYIMGNGIKEPAECEIKNINIVRKSIVAKKLIKKGEKLTKENLGIKRPGDGISPKYWEEIVGKFSTKDYYPDENIEWL